MKKICRFLLFLIPLTACVKQVDWPITEKGSDLIIVDAIITDESNIQTVKISYPATQLNQKSLPVSGATILISNEDSTWNLSEQPVNSGIYKSIDRLIVQTGKNYSLFISSNNKIYTSKAYMVPGSTFKELQYLKNSGNGLYYVDWVASAYSAEKSAMWEVLLDWSNVSGYENADSSSTHSRMLFYTLPTLDVSEIFAPEMKQVSFPAGTTITEKRYSLTPEHAEFARELLLETQWSGGYFNVSSSNVTTNFSSGAKGWFGACSITSLSLTVTP